VLAMTLHPGNTSGSLGTSKTIARWMPRYVLLVGIAGGLPREHLGLGDVVVSKQIVSYEYGKVERNAFNPRPDFVYQLDGPLLRNALSLGEANWRNKLGHRPGTDGGESKVLVGMVGAGEKVIDDRSADFFAAVEREFPKLLAVEMEGAGAAAAIQEARDEGRTVGFLMIRGISDMPPDKKTTKKPTAGKKASLAVSDRDQWKSYAARAAASFAVYFVSRAWPVPPSGTHEIPASNIGDVHSPRGTLPKNDIINELRDCLREAEWMLSQTEKCKAAMDAAEAWGEYALTYGEIRAFDLRSVDALKKVLPAESPLIATWHIHELDTGFFLGSHIRDFQQKIGFLRSALRTLERQPIGTSESAQDNVSGSAGQRHSIRRETSPSGTRRAHEQSASLALRIFLCHASTDKPRVRRLYSNLVADGFDAWLDEAKLLPGQDWRYEIERAVKASQIFIVCLSSRSVSKTGFVQREIKSALDLADERPEGTVFIVPIRLEECSVPERLCKWQWVDLFSPNGYERLLLTLSAASGKGST
ncbi:MAG TPA: TIR domain-containing protein, partial [Sorangium sp.]|nr:TIR domain-containing protein [Sorangium sp.]